MRVTYQHANPAAGNESFLLRFGDGDGETPCLLVDAGTGVDPSRLLGAGDRLVAVCLTHAHLDHYAALAAVGGPETPVLASPATAAILDDVLDVAGTEYGVNASRAVREAVTPVDGWHEPAGGVSVHPVPAGHAPGAVGWLVAVSDGRDTHRLLATGDFTRRRVAGFPGLPASELPPVDALFLTAATNDGFETALTEAVATAVEHAVGGKRTLVTTSGLTGVHVAYLLSAVGEAYGSRLPVRVVGQVAKLYERLGYDRPNVASITRFDDPRRCLDRGVVTVAGPEVPRERSSGRMFGLLREDPNASVIQLVGSGTQPVGSARCTLHDYELVNHPRRETLAAVHDAVAPTETVMVHAHRGAAGSFNDLGSVVWGTGDRTEYTLYDGQAWRLPPWMGGGRLSPGRTVGAVTDGDPFGDATLPALGRHPEPDLAAEGLDTERLAEALHRRTAPTATRAHDTTGGDTTDDGPDAAATPSRGDTDRVTDGTDDTDSQDPPEAQTMADDTTDGETAESNGSTPDRPIQTTGATDEMEMDPAAREMLERQGLTPEEAVQLLNERRAAGAAGDAGGDDDTGGDGPDDDTDAAGDAGGGDPDGTDAVGDGDGSDDDTDGSGDTDRADSAADETGDDSDGATATPTQAAGSASETGAEDAAPATPADERTNGSGTAGGATDDDTPTADDGDPDDTDHSGTTDDEASTGTDARADDAATDETTDDTATDDATTDDTATDDATTDDTATDDATTDDTATDDTTDDTATDDTTGDTATDDTTDDTADGDPADNTTTDDTTAADSPGEPSGPTASPLALALAPRATGESDPATAVATAVESYLVALLSGDATGDDDEAVSVDLRTHPAVETALAAAAADDDRYETDRELVVAGLAAALAPETADDTQLPAGRPVPALAPRAAQLRAVADNDDYVFETVTAVVDAAVAWALADESTD